MSHVNPLVSFQIAFLCEPFPTVHADVGSLSRVDPAVGLQVAEFGEAAAAERATELPLARVDLLMSSQVAEVREAFTTLRADVRRPHDMVSDVAVSPNADRLWEVSSSLQGADGSFDCLGPLEVWKCLRGFWQRGTLVQRMSTGGANSGGTRRQHGGVFLRLGLFFTQGAE